MAGKNPEREIVIEVQVAQRNGDQGKVIIGALEMAALMVRELRRIANALESLEVR